MKIWANHAVGLGVLLISATASLLGQGGQPTAPSHSVPQPAAAATSTDQPATAGNKPHDDSFIIGNDDRLAINVWKEPDLSRAIPVRSDGKISLPLVGEVQAAGRTPLQLEQDIIAKLRNYISDPEVTVMVEQINSEKFNILGQVQKPGSYSLTLASTVVDAIALSGGFRDFAKQKSMYIIRRNPAGGETHIAFNYKDFLKGKNSSQNVKLEPHDTIVVP